MYSLDLVGHKILCQIIYRILSKVFAKVAFTPGIKQVFSSPSYWVYEIVCIEKMYITSLRHVYGKISVLN